MADIGLPLCKPVTYRHKRPKNSWFITSVVIYSHDFCFFEIPQVCVATDDNKESVFEKIIRIFLDSTKLKIGQK